MFAFAYLNAFCTFYLHVHKCIEIIAYTFISGLTLMLAIFIICDKIKTMVIIISHRQMFLVTVYCILHSFFFFFWLQSWLQVLIKCQEQALYLIFTSFRIHISILFTADLILSSAILLPLLGFFLNPNLKL